jgi:hypothetical protein
MTVVGISKIGKNTQKGSSAQSAKPHLLSRQAESIAILTASGTT